jgi:hypothetical protein
MPHRIRRCINRPSMPLPRMRPRHSRTPTRVRTRNRTTSGNQAISATPSVDRAQQTDRFTPAQFADDDTVGAQPQIWAPGDYCVNRAGARCA